MDNENIVYAALMYDFEGRIEKQAFSSIALAKQYAERYMLEIEKIEAMTEDEAERKGYDY